jgi:hypothetical protein
LLITLTVAEFNEYSVYFLEMSENILVSIEDEEHILSADPGENFVDILKNVLGNVDRCTFTINGKKVTCAEELLKEHLTNARIVVTRPLMRAAFTSLGPRGLQLVIESRKNPSRPTIKVETVHISCSSDSYDVNENMAGFIVYSFDNKQIFELNGHRCRTGYILIKATKNIAHVKSKHGIVHGSLFEWFFGTEPNDKFVGAGFALHEQKFKFNSSVFNARNDDYHDGSKSMSKNEIDLIKYTINELFINDKWKRNPTLSVTNVGGSCYDSNDSLPIQNHPKTTMN